MNNLNFEKMAKKTVFTGVINGEKFDNVAAYNARMNELLSAGVENVSASSSTEIKTVDDTPVGHSGYVRSCTDEVCDTGTSTNASYDEDLSYYPYLEDDDPYYLDILVTNAHDVNVEARKEMHNILHKCYMHIINALYDNTIDVDTKKEYLADVRDIINTTKRDRSINADAINKINARKKLAEDEFRQAEEKYVKTLELIEGDELILNDAKPVIEDLINFYNSVEAEALQAINEQTTNRCTCGDHKCNCDVTKPTTTVTETVPQGIFDFQNVINRIFDDRRLF